MVSVGAAVWAAAWAMVPDAGVCAADPCAEVDAFVGVEQVLEVEVPTDGVLVLQANWFGELTEEALLAGLTWGVWREDVAVAGALEATPIEGVLVWRPGEPLRAGETYVGVGSFANAAEVPDVCGPPVVEVSVEFDVGAAPAEPLPAASLWTSAKRAETPLLRLDTVACCDGAMPVAEDLCDTPMGVVWSEGQCASTRGTAAIQVTMGVTLDVEESSASQWMWTWYQDGVEVASTLRPTWVKRITAPACYTVLQRSLATGEEVMSGERCIDGLIFPELGEGPLDPRTMLGAACAGELYVCAEADGRWDPDACAPWVPDPSLPPLEEGCGCAGGAGSGGPWAALVLLARRRRAVRSAVSRPG